MCLSAVHQRKNVLHSYGSEVSHAKLVCHHEDARVELECQFCCVDVLVRIRWTNIPP